MASSKHVVPKMEPPSQSADNVTMNLDQGDPANDAWDSEMQLVSSLAKLQKMEAMIHQLRTLLPERLLEPLVPIVNPRRAAPGRSVPKSPQMLFEQLSQTARAGVAEIGQFQSMWRSPEMKAIWDHVDAQIKQNGGQQLQPTGIWESDYDVLLEELQKEERSKNEERQKAEEEQERSKMQALEGGWRMIVENFSQKSGPGIRVVSSKTEATITVALVKAGMVFQFQALNGLEGKGVFDWRVSNKEIPGRPKTKLETAVAECLNSRPRQWDLAYLLEMVSSYSDVTQTPCMKCGKMTDNAAQLPSIRKPNPTPSSEGQQTLIWEAYHPGCI